MRGAAQTGGWASIPAALRILILSVFAAVLWLLFGVAVSASADEAPAPDHSLLGQVSSSLDSVVGQATAALASAPQSPPAAEPTAPPTAPAAPIAVSNLVTPVAQRLDSAVQALPVIRAIVSPLAVEAVTAPVTAGVDAVLGAIIPVVSLPVDVVEILPSISGAPAETVAIHATLPMAVDQRNAAHSTTGASDHSASVGAIAPDVSGSPSAPTPSAPASPGMLSSSAPSGSSGAAGGLVAVTAAASAADRALGRGSLPQNDTLPFSLSPAPGSSPD